MGYGRLRVGCTFEVHILLRMGSAEYSMSTPRKEQSKRKDKMNTKRMVGTSMSH